MSKKTPLKIVVFKIKIFISITLSKTITNSKKKKKPSTFFSLSSRCNTCRPNETRQYDLTANREGSNEVQSRRQWRVLAVYDKSSCGTPVNTQQPLPPLLYHYYYYGASYYIIIIYASVGIFDTLSVAFSTPKIDNGRGSAGQCWRNSPRSIRICIHVYTATVQRCTQRPY